MAQTSTISLSADRGTLALILIDAGNVILAACQFLPDFSLGANSFMRKKEWVRSIRERFADSSKPSEREAQQVGAGAEVNGQGQGQGQGQGKAEGKRPVRRPEPDVEVGPSTSGPQTGVKELRGVREIADE